MIKVSWDLVEARLLEWAVGGERSTEEKCRLLHQHEGGNSISQNLFLRANSKKKKKKLVFTLLGDLVLLTIDFVAPLVVRAASVNRNAAEKKK